MEWLQNVWITQNRDNGRKKIIVKATNLNLLRFRTGVLYEIPTTCVNSLWDPGKTIMYSASVVSPAIRYFFSVVVGGGGGEASDRV